jgi:isopenicillin-N epimerase
VRDLFLLDPDVVYLNHGSFGACPRPVFEEYQRLQLELEREPVDFLARDRRYPELIDAALRVLAEYVGAKPENLVFVPNATSALNAVARGLPLVEGDEVLAPLGEYGAVDMLWRYVCERRGARYVYRRAASLDELWEGTTPSTRVVCVSHVSCFTGVVFPVEELCRRARERDILTVVDGAHAPGQIPLALEELGADFYAGNCHKWLCAPKSSGFLYVRPERHDLAEPLIVSWDWEEEAEFSSRRRWEGTIDPAARLAVPAAIRFQEEHDWPAVRERCHALALEAHERFGQPAPGNVVQMTAVEVPAEAKALQRRLWEEHRIEVLAQELDGRQLLRLSFQAYNDRDDVDRLEAALGSIFR